MASLLNNYVFQLTGTLLTSGTTVTISNDLELDAAVAFTDARIGLRNRNATIIERCVGTAAAGTLTLSKRGLEQGDVEVENAGLKKEWREGTIVYVTILASQLVDKQNNNTFAGTQTFENVIVNGELTIPEYADGTARDAAIPSPTDGMIVQTGGVYQGYNSGTAQWEDFDIGTPAPNASTTVKGLVQIATDAEVGASTTTGSTGAELAVNPGSVVKTSSGAGDENKLPALNASGKLAAGFIDNAAILAEGIEALVDKDTYRLGEDADAGDSLFVEDMVTFASATSVQNIGDVTGNTRVSIPVIGSGVAASTLKLALKKFVSPSVDLGVRIETDNAGSPSGTLVDPDATSTVLESGLTTSLVDTTVTLADTITIPEGERVHIVLFAGTYGSETINGTNYFGVGYADKNTTTRQYKIYNGSTRGFSNWASPVSDAGNDVLSQSQAGSPLSCGMRIQAKFNLRLVTVTKHASSTATRCRVYSDANVLLSTATFSGNVATLSSPLSFSQNEYFKIECDASGSNYTYRRLNSGSTTFPYNKTNVIYVSGSNALSNSSNAYNITNVDTELAIANRFAYISSSLFTPKLLSLTDATYSYKLPTDLPRVLTESKTAGEYCIATTLGFNDNFSGLTPLAKYYISDTPGVISSTVGTNVYPLGQAIDSTTLNVVRKYGVGTISTLNTTVAAASTTVTSDSFLATFDAEFGFIFDLNVSGASSSATGTIQYSTDNSTRYTMQTESIGAGASRSYRVIPVITGRYYRTSVNQNVNRTGGTTTITLDMVRPL